MDDREKFIRDILKESFNKILRDFPDEYDDLSKDDLEEIPKDLKKLFKNLVETKVDNENIKKSLIQDILRIKEIHNRFLYSQITAICYDLKDREEEENIIWNLKRLYYYSKEYNNEDEYLIVFKLYDHVNLAFKQSNRFKNISKNFDEKMEQEKKGVRMATKAAIDSVEKTKGKLMGELISLIGIFTALSFVLFGGISSIGSLTNSIEAVLNNNYDISIIYKPIIIWGIVMFNVLYLFMYFIFKLTGNSRSIFKEDGLCKKIKLFFSKYSLVILINCLLFLLYCKL